MSDRTDIAARRRESRVLVLACLVAALLGAVFTFLVGGSAPARSAVARAHLEADAAMAAGPGPAGDARAGVSASTPPATPSGKRTVPQQLITVSAPSARATRAWVQRWTLTDGRWVAAARPVPAEIGAAGLTRRPTEGRAATPLGVFTLTDAFGAGSNTGHAVTRMAYFQVRYGDSWGSDPHKPTYNRRWNCRCGDGELYRLRGTYFRYGLVIDYNRDPIVRGAGSGFFVHVTDGHPTGGCVGLPAGALATTLRWLDPAARPRIYIRISAPGQVPSLAPAR